MTYVLRVSLVAILLLTACDCPPRGPVAILAINDVYRIEGLSEGRQGGLARVRTLRDSLERLHGEVLLLHGGDLLFPSLMSRTFRGAQMIDVLNLLDGQPTGFDSLMVVVFGNHEFDDARAAGGDTLARRVRESGFWWIASNIESATLDSAHHLNLRSTLIPDVSGVRVGIFGLTVGPDSIPYAVVRDGLGDLLRRARHLTADLRKRGADVVIALTHLNLETDRRILTLGAAGPDLIIGGHEHERQVESVRGRWVLKADSDARSATVALVTPRRSGRPPRVQRTTVALNANTLTHDPTVQRRIQAWTTRHDTTFCRNQRRQPGCLDSVLAHTTGSLVGEELVVRSREASLGNWVADQMRAAVASVTPVDIAFINAGALRLNQDIPAGRPIKLRHVEELIQYDSRLQLVRLAPQTLRAVLEHSASCIGQGGWLQVSGLSFTVDYATLPRVREIAVRGRPLEEMDSVLAVTIDFLVTDRERDGYKMLDATQIRASPVITTLREAVLGALRVTPNLDPPPDTGRIRIRHSSARKWSSECS